MAGRGNWIFQSLRTIVWFIYTVIIETPIIVVLSIITFPYYLLQWFLKFFKTPNVASSPLPNSKDKLLPELPNVKKYDPKKVTIS